MPQTPISPVICVAPVIHPGLRSHDALIYSVAIEGSRKRDLIMVPQTFHLAPTYYNGKYNPLLRDRLVGCDVFLNKAQKVTFRTEATAPKTIQRKRQWMKAHKIWRKVPKDDILMSDLKPSNTVSPKQKEILFDFIATKFESTDAYTARIMRDNEPTFVVPKTTYAGKIEEQSPCHRVITIINLGGHDFAVPAEECAIMGQNVLVVKKEDIQWVIRKDPHQLTRDTLVSCGNKLPEGMPCRQSVVDYVAARTKPTLNACAGTLAM